MCTSSPTSSAPYPIANALPAATVSATAVCCSQPRRYSPWKPRQRFAFAETKEQLAGFYLLDAANINAAIEAAAKIPPAREGSIEVRPVRELDV